MNNDKTDQAAERARLHKKRQTDMSEADASLNPAGNIDNPSPGAMLRAARERTQYTVRDIAAQLRLDARIIEALEADRYDEMPAPAFVRGYLRGYANLLQLPIKPIIEAYDRRNFEAPEILASVDSVSATYSRIPELSSRMLLYGFIAAVLIGLGAWWWQSQPVSIEAPPDAEAAALGSGVEALNGEGVDGIMRDLRQWFKKAQDALAKLTSDDELSDEVAGDARPDQANGAGVAGEASLPPAADASAAPAVAEATTQALTAAKVVIADAATLADQVVSPQGGDTSAQAAVSLPLSAESLPGAVAPGDASTTENPEAIDVTFDFSATSWVEVYTGDQRKRIAFQVAPPGTRLELQGKAPIDVVLGAPRAVEFWLEGQLQSIIQYAPSGVARFYINANKQLVAGSSVPPPPPEPEPEPELEAALPPPTPEPEPEPEAEPPPQSPPDGL